MRNSGDKEWIGRVSNPASFSKIQLETKHVEGLWVLSLDASSTQRVAHTVTYGEKSGEFRGA